MVGGSGTPIELSIDGMDETWITNQIVDPNVPYVVSEAPDAGVGDLDITESINITGAGSALTVIQWSEVSKTDGDPATGDRIFQVKPTDSDITVLISALGAAVLHVELRDDGLATDELRKQGRLYGRVGVHEGLWMGEKRVRQPVSSASGAFVLSAFAHYPG